MYLLGGYDETQSLQASVFVADATNNFKFEVCPRMPYPVYRPAVASWENYLYAFGGFGKGGVPYQFIQCFDIANQKWSEIRPGFRGVHTGCHYAVAIESFFYVVCGQTTTPYGIEHPMVGHDVAKRCIDSVLRFCPISKQWTDLFRFPKKRTGSFSITSLENRIYITGGLKGGNPCNTIECFDPRTNSLEVVGSARDGTGMLTLCTTMKAMHENFGL